MIQAAAPASDPGNTVSATNAKIQLSASPNALTIATQRAR